MTAERWAHITGVFRAALEEPAGERGTFLDGACGSDEALRRNVERLLAGEAEPSFPSPLPELLVGGALELAPGDMLAQYRIEAKIGEGGMGAVYRAHDTRLHRRVALKVLPTAGRCCTRSTTRTAGASRWWRTSGRACMANVAIAAPERCRS